MSSICENLRSVEDRIDKAARKSGRRREDITLVTVTKTRGIDEIREAIACGATDLGENYVQEAEGKFAAIGDAARWQMIGHLQRNKARHAVEFFSLIQSVDSVELAEEIGRRAQAIGKRLDVLVEVKISGEATKFGVDPEATLGLVSNIAQVSGIRVCGLMGMAPFAENPQDTRPFFVARHPFLPRSPNIRPARTHRRPRPSGPMSG